MKKTLIGIIVMVVMLFSACTGVSVSYDSESEYKTGKETTLPQEEPNYYPPIHYQSYEDLTGFASQIAQGAEPSPGTTDDELLIYQNATEKLDRQALPIPCLNGNRIALHSATGESAITLFHSELYLKPWIWYETDINNQAVTVRIMLDQDVVRAFDEGDSCAEVVKHIAPDAPNVDNYQDFDGYEKIFEQSITTADGAKIALVQRESSRDREYISFMQNGFLVTIAGPQGVITDDWLEMFSVMQGESLENDHVAE